MKVGVAVHGEKVPERANSRTQPIMDQKLVAFQRLILLKDPRFEEAVVLLGHALPTRAGRVFAWGIPKPSTSTCITATTWATATGPMSTATRMTGFPSTGTGTPGEPPETNLTAVANHTLAASLRVLQASLTGA
jgi:hypothetical protein